MKWIEDYHMDLVNLDWVSHIQVKETGSNDEYKYAVYADTIENTFVLMKSSSEQECREFLAKILMDINSSNTPKRSRRLKSQAPLLLL